MRDALTRIPGETRGQKALLKKLDDASRKIPIVRGQAEGALDRIEALFGSALALEPTDAARLRAADRALHRKAPCHHENKNSIADALLFELYSELVAAAPPGERLAFVTHNRSDFSAQNQKVPHPDIASQFSKIRSMYCINLAELLRRIDPSTVSHVLWEAAWEIEPRGLHEFLKAENMLFYQFGITERWRCETASPKASSRSSPKEWDEAKIKGPERHRNMVVDTIWESSLIAQRQTERRYGLENLGPWSDFEWE